MIMTKRSLHKGLALAGLSLLFLSGCEYTDYSGATGNVSGTVMGGLSPIAGSNITVYEATPAAPIVLDRSASDSQGNFSVNYKVPALGAYVYIVANGGITNGANNPNINLVSVLGEEPNLATPLTINEITTVGAYQALTNNWSKTASTPTLIAGPNSAVAMNIGFTNYHNLVNLTTGQLSSNFPLTTTIDSTGYQLATQANVLALCVQNPAYCPTLASSAYLSTTQADTFHLMGGLKTTNATQRADITSLLHSNSLPAIPYAADTLNQSALTVVAYEPSSFTGNSIATDSLGNVWASDLNAQAVVKIPVGSTPNTPNLQIFTGFNNPYGIATDADNNAWVANRNGNSVIEIPAGSTSSSPNLQTFTGFNRPNRIATDAQGNVWVANFNGSSVTEIPAGSTPGSPNLQTFTGFNFPQGIATDVQGNVWVANNSNSVIEIPAGSTPSSPNLQTFTGFSNPVGIATDTQGNVWVTSSSGNSVTEIIAGSTPSSPNLQSFTGFNSPIGIATDSQNNVWVANNGDNNVVEIPAGSTPSTILPLFFGFNDPIAISSDPQGNIWVVVVGDGVTEMLN